MIINFCFPILVPFPFTHFPSSSSGHLPSTSLSLQEILRIPYCFVCVCIFADSKKYIHEKSVVLRFFDSGNSRQIQETRSDYACSHIIRGLLAVKSVQIPGPKTTFEISKRVTFFH